MTTRWWSGWWWLWWILIFFAIFIFVAALICMCFICFCWPRWQLFPLHFFLVSIYNQRINQLVNFLFLAPISYTSSFLCWPKWCHIPIVDYLCIHLFHYLFIHYQCYFSFKILHLSPKWITFNYLYLLGKMYLILTNLLLYTTCLWILPVHLDLYHIFHNYQFVTFRNFMTSLQCNFKIIAEMHNTKLI